MTFNLAALQAPAPYRDRHLRRIASVTDTCRRVAVECAWARRRPAQDSSIKNDILRKVITVTGSDGYQVAFSAGELSPMFGKEPILVAYADTAGQLGAGGPAVSRALVVPGDIAGGRGPARRSACVRRGLGRARAVDLGDAAARLRRPRLRGLPRKLHAAPAMVCG